MWKLSKKELIELSAVTILSFLVFFTIFALTPISLKDLGYISMGPAVVCFLFLPFRPCVAIGSLLGFTFVAAGVGWWVGSDIMGWLYYPYSIPGGFMASLLVMALYRPLKNRGVGDFALLGLTAFAVIVGTVTYGVVYFSFMFDYL